MTKVLVVTFGRKSNDNQAITLARHIAKEDKIYIKKILFNSLVSIPNFISRFIPAWLMVKKSDSFLDVDDCDVIISCGRRTLSYCKFLKKNNFPNAKLIQILNPDIYDKSIDLLLMPDHDKRVILEYENIINYKGSIFEEYDKKELEQSLSYFKPNISKLKKPLISLIIGGSSRNFKYTRKFVENFINNILKIAEKTNATLLVTTSRRTDNFAIEILRNKIKSPSILFVFDPRNDINPFLSFIHLSDFNIVTGDSISMISEMINLEKPLYVIKPNIDISKYENFYNSAIEDGKVRFLDDFILELENFKTHKLNDLTLLVQKIKETLKI